MGREGIDVGDGDGDATPVGARQLNFCGDSGVSTWHVLPALLSAPCPFDTCEDSG
jgi:hypothetical protein